MNTQERKQDAIDTLKKLVNPGQTVYGLVASRTANGSNFIRFMTIVDGRIWDISLLVSTACGYSWSDSRQAVKVVASGTGAVFTAVYKLSGILFSDHKALNYSSL